jgi:hypothetical protein
MKLRTKLIILFVALTLVLSCGVYRFNKPGLAKNGIGIIRNDAGYVFVRGERNQIQWQEDDVIHRWAGKPRTQSETIYFDRHQVHRFSWGNVVSGKGFVIRFMPNRIQVIDLENLEGESYSPRMN